MRIVYLGVKLKPLQRIKQRMANMSGDEEITYGHNVRSSQHCIEVTEHTENFNRIQMKK